TASPAPALTGQPLEADLLTTGKGAATPAVPTTLAALLGQAAAAPDGTGKVTAPSADAQATPALAGDAAPVLQAGPTGQQANAATAQPAGAFALNALPMAKHDALPADMAALVASLATDTKALDKTADAGADTSITDVRAALSMTQPAPLAAARDVAVVAPPSVVPNMQGDAFSEEIGAHLKWMADQKVGHAHLRISPDDMGTVDIRLKLDGDRVSADFSAAQADVRQALEQSLPRLRELLGQHGFQLAHADVGQQSRQNSDAPGQLAGRGGTVETPDDGTITTVSVASLLHRGLLDAYA
ncbi:MAG: flagellar hook-length control protein FliK, partial [Pseudoxanthomonas sp.]